VFGARGDDKTFAAFGIDTMVTPQACYTISPANNPFCRELLPAFDDPKMLTRLSVNTAYLFQQGTVFN
jgi:hypothetical protein